MANQEEKKAKKPRTTKKAGAGTKLSVEAVEEKVSVERVETSAEGTNTPQKTPVKRGRKKSEAVAEETQVEAPIAENKDAKNKPTSAEKKKPAAKKKTAKKEAAVEAEKQLVQEKAQAAEEGENAAAEVKAEKKAPAKSRRKKTVLEAKEPSVDSTVEKVETAEEKPQEAAEKKTIEKEEKSQGEPKETTSKKTKKSVGKPIKTEEKKAAPTKAEKKDFVKKLTREILGTECKWSELIDRVAQGYKEAYPIPENDNLNDVKGRVGSVVHVMQEEGEIVIEGNLVKLASQPQKTEQVPTVSAVKTEQVPTVSATKEEKVNEKQPKKEMKTEAKEEKLAVVDVSEKSLKKVEAAAPAPVYDLSALFDKKKTLKKAEPAQKSVEELAKEKTEEVQNTKVAEAKTEEIVAPVKAEVILPVSAKTELAEKKVVPAKKQEDKPTEKPLKKEVPTRRPMRSAKADPLKDMFLRKLRSLGGNYFEYYAIYLLERYSRMNGRRLEGLRVSGGEYDGGIDGELELTDRLGFRETIYIQAKNWEPTDERWWIGETILQQFIGAVTYRQAKEGKQHCRGMFITTSAFTVGAREMLDKLSDKFVGYDGDDLYETAKECQFGLIKDEKGNWKVDEELLSGKKSFFFML